MMVSQSDCNRQDTIPTYSFPTYSFNLLVLECPKAEQFSVGG